MTIFAHQCMECGCSVLHAPGTCDVCIDYMKSIGVWKEPESVPVAHQKLSAVGNCWMPWLHNLLCDCKHTGNAVLPVGAPYVP